MQDVPLASVEGLEQVSPRRVLEPLDFGETPAPQRREFGLDQVSLALEVERLAAAGRKHAEYAQGRRDAQGRLRSVHRDVTYEGRLIGQGQVVAAPRAEQLPRDEGERGVGDELDPQPLLR